MSMMVQTQAYTLRPHVVATVVDNGAVLLDLQTKFFYQLNASAWSIVQLFENGAVTLADVDAYIRTWSAGNDGGSVDAFIETLRQSGLIGEAPSPAPSDATAPAMWEPPTIVRQSAPLQRLVMSAFDPTMPLAE